LQRTVYLCFGLVQRKELICEESFDLGLIPILFRIVLKILDVVKAVEELWDRASFKSIKIFFLHFMGPEFDHYPVGAGWQRVDRKVSRTRARSQAGTSPLYLGYRRP